MKKFLQLVFILLCVSTLTPNVYAENPTASLPSVAFYYGDNIPIDELHAFNLVIVTPIPSFNAKTFNTTHSQALAYVSVGEVGGFESYSKSVKPTWTIGNNKVWKAKVMDLSNPEWRTFLLDDVFTPLWNQGYQGFFLDTLDSYQLATKTPEQKAKQIAGLDALIKSIKQKFPTAKIILNRGFELLPEIHNDIYAIAGESLYGAWDQANHRYTTVSNNDRTYLLNQFNKAHNEYKLPIISIDYAPLNDRPLAREIASKIEKDGFIPWVTDGSINSVGVGSVEVMPREILMIYDGSKASHLIDTSVARYAAMPLNYLGYVPVYHEIHQPFSDDILTGRYAGIVVWLRGDEYPNQNQFHQWILQQINQGMKVVFLDYFGFEIKADNLTPLGIKVYKYTQKSPTLNITAQAPMMGFEFKPRPEPYSFTPILLNKGNALLQITDGNGSKSVPAAITPWGGYILSPYAVTYLPNQQARWVVNPLQFFQTALQLPIIPVPDTTTENGLRLLMAHVDGDAFISRAEWNPNFIAGQVIEHDILEHFRIPTAISVIIAEVAPFGISPLTSNLAMSVARSIFKLPWVEIASHSWSHPFYWSEVTVGTSNPKLFLPIPGYKFSTETEVTGSVDWINKNLAPLGKLCKVYLWPGDTNPPAEAVALAYKDHLASINGGDTLITKTNNSWTNIAPLGVPAGSYFQVYAPNQNEDTYTNNWLGPFYGFLNVIETYQLTNSPIRFKPIDIYYHFYSGTKLASISALTKVYEWALQQPTMKIFLSQYFYKVLDFNSIVIAKTENGWEIINNGQLRELRLPANVGTPDLQLSTNIIGYAPYNQDNYIHLGPATESELVLVDNNSKSVMKNDQLVSILAKINTVPYLGLFTNYFIYLNHSESIVPFIVYADGTVTQFQRRNDGFVFSLKSFLPISFTLANMMGCNLVNHGHTVLGKSRSPGAFDYYFHETLLTNLQVICPQ